MRASDLAPRPRTLDHAHSAEGPLSALTAWQALFRHAGLTAGQRVLIHGAAGGFGAFAAHLAHWRGARVSATASERHHEFLRGMGIETGEAKATHLSRRDIVEKLDGKDAGATVEEVAIEPGGRDAPHRHAGPVFGYVLEGEYEHALDDDPITKYKAGDTFYEPSGGPPSGDEVTERQGDDAPPLRDLAPSRGR